MKKLFLFCLLCIFITITNAQVNYYRGEWTKSGSSELFSGIFKIEIQKDGSILGELVWTYLASDSTDEAMVNMYKGKRSLKGIEYVAGNYTASTHDIYFEGKDKTDPRELIGTDKYSLKLSADKLVLYGTTDANGSGKGLFYAILLDAKTGKNEFAAAKAVAKK